VKISDSKIFETAAALHEQRNDGVMAYSCLMVTGQGHARHCAAIKAVYGGAYVDATDHQGWSPNTERIAFGVLALGFMAAIVEAGDIGKFPRD